MIIKKEQQMKIKFESHKDATDFIGKMITVYHKDSGKTFDAKLIGIVVDPDNVDEICLLVDASDDFDNLYVDVTECGPLADWSSKNWDLSHSKARPGVHATHCCDKHSYCKYGEEYCPVVNGEIKSVYGCEFCHDDF